MFKSSNCCGCSKGSNPHPCLPPPQPLPCTLCSFVHGACKRRARLVAQACMLRIFGEACGSCRPAAMPWYCAHCWDPPQSGDYQNWQCSGPERTSADEVLGKDGDYWRYLCPVCTALERGRVAWAQHLADQRLRDEGYILFSMWQYVAHLHTLQGLPAMEGMKKWLDAVHDCPVERRRITEDSTPSLTTPPHPLTSLPPLIFYPSLQPLCGS